MPKYSAKTADKHKLYEKAVQCVEADIDFVSKIYRKRHDKRPRLLREDFCGTFAAAVDFVKRNKQNRAIAVDLDGDVLDWGRKHNLPKLKKRQDDLTILQENVLDVRAPQVDILLAMNFSYFIFKTREALKTYFKTIHDALLPGGIVVMDAYGGSEAQVPQFEETEKDGFTYIWDQDKYDPITNEVMNYIHFEFPDGSKMKKAFAYDWRLWTLREITELLTEVGFASADVYWEGWDEDGESGDGKFKLATNAENSEGWIAYIVGEKGEA